jgi:hypothetical protein
VALALTALCDIPANLTVASGSTGSAVSTACFAGLIVFLVPSLALMRDVGAGSRNAQAATAPLWPFLLWAVAAGALHGVGKYGIQNLAVFVMLIAGSALIAATDARRPEQIYRILIGCAWLTAAVYAASVVLHGAGTSTFFGARSFAIEALPLLAVAVAYSHRSRAGRLLPWVLFMLIVLSLSRTAMFAGLVLMVFHMSRGRGGRSTAKMLIALVLVSAAAYVAVDHVSVIRDRFTEGDRGFSVGGTTLDTEGRNVIWPLVWHSAQEHAWLGAGPGTSTVLVSQTLPPETEPHNDYLRLWHDYGLVGLALWCGGYAWAIASGIARARRAPAGSAMEARQVAAALALVALALVMLTDNAIIYPFAVAPVMLLVGCAAESRHREVVGPVAVPVRVQPAGG